MVESKFYKFTGDLLENIVTQLDQLGSSFMGGLGGLFGNIGRLDSSQHAHSTGPAENTVEPSRQEMGVREPTLKESQAHAVSRVEGLGEGVKQELDSIRHGFTGICES